MSSIIPIGVNKIGYIEQEGVSKVAAGERISAEGAETVSKDSDDSQEIQSNELLQLKLLDEKISGCNRQLSLFADSSLIYYQLAFLYFKKYNLTKEESLFKTADEYFCLAETGGGNEVCSDRGLLYFKHYEYKQDEKSFQEAKRLFLKQIEITPDNFNAKLFLGKLNAEYFLNSKGLDRESYRMAYENLTGCQAHSPLTQNLEDLILDLQHIFRKVNELRNCIQLSEKFSKIERNDFEIG